MKTKEFAAMFQMSVNEMCEFTGFSRDGLNEIVKGRSKKDGIKKRDARHELRDRASVLYAAAQEVAKKEYEARIEATNNIFGIQIAGRAHGKEEI